MVTGMTKKLDTGLAIFIGATVLLSAVAALYPVAAAAGNDANTSGIPLGTLLAGGGVVFIVLAAIVLKAIITHK